MKRTRIFISSVQAEFALERQMLFQYLHSDPLLGKFFEPFIFEQLPALEKSAQKVFLKEVEQSDIYLGIFGQNYGYEDKHGVSPTEREYDHATLLHKTRLIFLTSHSSKDRHPKENMLIRKAEMSVVRKQFNSPEELRAAVYASLIRYLEEKELIRVSPFDASVQPNANLDDIDSDRLKEFVISANNKRGFPVKPEAGTLKILTHLNLLSNNRPVNAAILLFGKHPQRHFLTSEIKCAHFHGREIVKPIPSYQVYKGDVFQLIDQAVDFVLSRINFSVGERTLDNQSPTNYEIPRAAVAEAIVNAVAHRDYTSNGSVQVMLFTDRLEIWNPGSLPFGLTVEKLREPHPSIPANPLLAESMYLAAYIERMGTGTGDIIRLCDEQGLKPAEFIQEENFKTILWRIKSGREAGREVGGELTGEVSGEALDIPSSVANLVLVMGHEEKRRELQIKLNIKSDDYFRVTFILPALEQGVIAMKFPETPNHPNQRYSLTQKGKKFKDKLCSKK